MIDKVDVGVLGAIVVGVPLWALALIMFWKTYKLLFWFAFALIIVGLGYLSTTGALNDIGAVAKDVIANIGSAGRPATK